MARSSRAPSWAAIVADFRRSGLTHVAFCQTRRISIHSFRKWLYRLPTPAAEANAPVHPSTTRFLPVHIRPESRLANSPPLVTRGPATLELVLGEHRRARVPVGFDPDTLHQLLDVLEERP